jgi:hypothetical protein
MIESRVMPFGNRRPPASADRVAVARLLAGRGPMSGEDAARALGWTARRWWDVVGRSKDWFGLTGTGWVLTDEARQALAEG